MELKIKFNEEMLVEIANRVLDEYEYKGKTIREWADLIAHSKTNVEYIEREAVLDAIEHMKPYHQDADDIAEMIQNFPAANVVPVVQRDAVMQALNSYFSIGDSDTYELTRVKEAFYTGTMTFDDFEEWNEGNVSDLCDYLMKELFCPNCGGD